MHVVRKNQIQEVDDNDDVDYELPHPSQLSGTHINSIPLASAVQAARLFYGNRFFNQALALKNGEAPLVQNVDTSDKQGRSFDELLGESLGAVKAKRAGKVLATDPDRIAVQYDDGEKADVELYNNFSFNQKGGNSSRTLVKPGDTFVPGQVLAASNHTDDNGVQSMGLNARIALVPYRGYSIDDAIPISESFAKRLTAIQYTTVKQDSSAELKTGLGHYRALFPTRFTQDTLKNFDQDGLVKPGTVLREGDPVILSTMPRAVSSAGANIGKLSKALRQSRRDSAQVWDGPDGAEVVAARKTRNGYKVVVRYEKPTAVGDKLVLRQGSKATVSALIPDDRMPRTEDGRPVDMLLNPLALTSRANPASAHELRIGKVARAIGKAIKIPAYLPKGQDWNDFIDKLEQEHGVSATERLFDPETGKFLGKPVTVGDAFVMKLHHTSAGKLSSRGLGGYDANQQPARGAGDAAKAKRFSGLENFATLSSGAYALMREHSTLRGQRSDDYWRALRAGKPLPKVGTPFVWHKFRALLSGAGIQTKDLGDGKIRLAPFRDADLDEKDPVDIDNGETVDISSMDPIPGGLFDPRIVTGERWGRIRLPRPVLNPAMEDSARVLLGLTKSQLDSILRGEDELPEPLARKLGLRA